MLSSNLVVSLYLLNPLINLSIDELHHCELDSKSLIVASVQRDPDPSYYPPRLESIVILMNPDYAIEKKFSSQTPEKTPLLNSTYMVFDILIEFNRDNRLLTKLYKCTVQF